MVDLARTQSGSVDGVLTDPSRYKPNPLGSLNLLPDPEPSQLWCPMISADDHVLEPATVFDRVPAKYRDLVPKQIIADDGRPRWLVDGTPVAISGGNGACGRPVDQWRVQALSYDEVRPGVYDVDARIRDLDLNGVWASVTFPSVPWGFAGWRLSKLNDRDAALAAVQAYNDWMIEEWCGKYPERLIPCQLPWLNDPEVAASEIVKNADRGFKSVSFSEDPAGLGFPGIYTDYWEPFFAACEETETVVNLHTGSSGSVTRTPVSAPINLFALNAVQSLVDWVYSKVVIRFPRLKIALSEGGASWVPMVIEHMQRGYEHRETSVYWKESDPHPIDLVHRNFWFSSLEDPSAFRLLDVIGEDHVVVETDYPHSDSTWPLTQQILERDLKNLPTATIKKICFENAAKLYRHPKPPEELIANSLSMSSPRPT